MRQRQCNRVSSLTLIYLLPALLALLAVNFALAQAPFYQGKTITLIVGAGPGGMGDLRAKALASILAKQIPGNPTIMFQYMPGGGGRKAANHLYGNTRADGLTLFRISSSIVPYAVLGESGVQYDIDKLIYLGTTEHLLYYLFNTRARRVSTPWPNSAPPRASASAALQWGTPGTYKAVSPPTCSI